MGMHVTTVNVTTVGSDGVATGSAVTEELFNAKIWSIFLDFHASAPGTTDVTIAYTTRGGNIYGKDDTATDVLVYPRTIGVNNTGTAVAYSHIHFIVHEDTLTVTVSGCNALTNALVAYIYWEDMNQ